MKQAGPRRKLIGFSLNDRAFPRQGYPIHAGGRPIGAVTSGMFSPVLEKGIGMGYVETPFAKPGTAINICIRNNEVPATVVPVPFIPKK